MGLDMTLTKINPVEVGYWRKANAIHKWFVDNIQDGDDNCQPHDVPYDKLLELRAVCLKVLDTKDTSLLPPCEGFFFGTIELDEYYFGALAKTVAIIDKLDPDGEYQYRSSW